MKPTKKTTPPGRRIVQAFLILVGLPASSAAQSADGTCDRYPSLGITGITCRNCTISRSGPDRWAAFSTEPRILSVASDGPSAGILRADDVLVAVDGHLVTTGDGGRAFTDFEAGDEVHLRIRRDGRERDVTVTAEARCAPRPPAPVPAPAVMPAPGAAPVPEAAAAPPAPAPAAAPPRGPMGPPPAPEPPGEVASRMWRYSRGLPRLGMSLSCDRCTLRVDDEEGAVWSFDQYPEVRSVEDGSAAAEAGFRGGDVLLRIDGIDLRTPAGGGRMARVRPGERVEWQIVRDGVVRTLRHTLPASVSPPAPAAPVAPAPPGPVRAVTRIGDVDVEVRGDPVVVLEDDGVVVIRAEGVEVRLARRPPPPAPVGGGG